MCRFGDALAQVCQPKRLASQCPLVPLIVRVNALLAEVSWSLRAKFPRERRRHGGERLISVACRELTAESQDADESWQSKDNSG